jgi:hypothetical protein
MADLVVIVGVLGFFGIAAVYIALCDRIIGSDPSAVGEAREGPAGEVAAGTEVAR